ncbi:hypothetical protein CEXT_175991 [Caerostris extrusa]|uniref:Uncharacterized protein n=1 Tax=Caerostris extrusa TaxID=172846 RepID=A0AAV4NPH6_CAEEX|nr:hypothetical protein CEXT_175991 [Caerostris extrusa]
MVRKKPLCGFRRIRGKQWCVGAKNQREFCLMAGNRLSEEESNTTTTNTTTTNTRTSSPDPQPSPSQVNAS